MKKGRMTLQLLETRSYKCLLLVSLMLLSCASLAVSQYDDDASASYDYDGTLILNSRNFREMTSQGVWVVMFYSYSVVIKRTEEAYHCRSFTWLWGDLATRFSELGGEPNSGPTPSIHIAKFDTSMDTERRFVASILRSERIEELPAVFIIEGDQMRKLPPADMEKILNNLPDIDRLEGYSTDMTCDPPSDYYDAYSQNQENLHVLANFVSEYLADTRRVGLSVPRPEFKEYDSGVDENFDMFNPTEEIIAAARQSVKTGDRSFLIQLLDVMQAENGTDINARDPLTLETSLHVAAAGGEAEVVALLLEMGAAWGAVDAEGETSLFKASERGRRAVIRVLVEAGGDIDVPRHTDGATPIHIAAYLGHGDVCAMLINEGADVEIRTPKGQSPLHFCAITGYVHDNNAAEALVKNGADIDGKDHAGFTPVMFAVNAHNLQMVELLCSLGAKVNLQDNSGSTALHIAMMHGSVDAVKILLKWGADPYIQNVEGVRAMDVVCLQGNHIEDSKGRKVFTGKMNKEMNNLLRSYRWWLLPTSWLGPFARPDIRFKMMKFEDNVREKIRKTWKKMATFFRKEWHNSYKFYFTSNQPSTPYEKFQQKRLLEIDEFHDKQTPGGDPEGDIWLFEMGNEEFERVKTYTELQRAVYFQELSLADQLLKEGRVPYARDPDSMEADASQILLPSGQTGRGELRHQGAFVDIEVRDQNGSSPVALAINNGDIEMVDLLASYGARLDTCDYFGWSPLMLAVKSNRKDIVDLLLSYGASPDYRNEIDKNQTASMLAAEEGLRPILVSLLHHGADLDCQDSCGQTVLNYAFSARRDDLCTWLIKLGATMREDGVLRGFDPIIDLSDLPDYSPLDNPLDEKNPRFLGAM